MSNESLPALHPRKTDGLEMHTVADQVAVYDTVADRLHYLNPTAALVLDLCDGSHSAPQIAALVQEAYGLDAAPLTEIANCVADLKQTGLVL
jgi:hypothetical protein